MTVLQETAAAVHALASALRQAANDPADATRLLAALAASAGNGPTGVFCRRAAVVELCRAAADYRPTSYDDAAGLRARLCALLDREITDAGDAGEDEVFRAFHALRAAVVQDLTARGASLARVVAVERRRSLPAAVLAHQLYRDATRAEELVERVDPPHPLFLPPTFAALDR